MKYKIIYMVIFAIMLIFGVIISCEQDKEIQHDKEYLQSIQYKYRVEIYFQRYVTSVNYRCNEVNYGLSMMTLSDTEENIDIMIPYFQVREFRVVELK